MKFRNYCIVVLGKTEGCILEISKVSEGSPKTLPAKGICIATFVSAFTPIELEDYFKGFGRNFFVFEIDPETSGYNINNKKVSDNLFKHINNDSTLELEEMSNRIIDEIKSTTNYKPITGSSKGVKIETKTKVEEVDNEFYEALNPNEKQSLIDEIIDKGPLNLTTHDKEILEILSKKW